MGRLFLCRKTSSSLDETRVDLIVEIWSSNLSGFVIVQREQGPKAQVVESDTGVGDVYCVCN